jgi:hypothetical protein
MLPPRVEPTSYEALNGERPLRHRSPLVGVYSGGPIFVLVPDDEIDAATALMIEKTLSLAEGTGCFSPGRRSEGHGAAARPSARADL